MIRYNLADRFEYGLNGVKFQDKMNESITQKMMRLIEQCEKRNIVHVATLVHFASYLFFEYGSKERS